MPLSNDEKIRYSRHLNLPQFGLETQEKLKNSSVLVVGTGGLGAPMLQYLTAAGVGKIGVVDFDTVDETNLQRQVLFNTNDVGKEKTKAAIEKLKSQNPHVQFIEHNIHFNSGNALEIIKDYDVVADGTDNFPTRYLVNDACVLSGKTNVYASIFQFEGQVSVFNYHNGEEYGPNYRDLYPTPPPPGMVPSCAEGGVLGVLPGIVGSLQALEVIKVLTGIGTPLSGKLVVFDALDFAFRKLNVRKDPSNPISGESPTITELIDYEEFCGLKKVAVQEGVITVSNLQQWVKEGRKFQLIDVRDIYEHDAGNLGGTNIPLGELEKRQSEIPREGGVVVYCKIGGRSASAIEFLKSKYGYNNLLNLEGGILAWKREIENNITVV